MSAVETINLTDLPAWAANRDRLLAQTDYRPLFRTFKVMLSASAKQNFSRGQAPDGSTWLPLKNPSRRRGGPASKPLRDTDRLMASVTANGAGHFETEAPARLEWGTNVHYAGFHQGGTRRIPARPFLGFNRDLVAEMEAALAEFAALRIAS